MEVKPELTENTGSAATESVKTEEKTSKRHKKSEKVSQDKGSSQKKDDISFEEAIEQLEETVRLLEEGKTSLDKSMELYEKGVRLIRICKGQLEGAKQKIKILGGNGEPDGTGDSNTKEEF